MTNSKQEINLQIWTLEPWVRPRPWLACLLGQEFSDQKPGVCSHCGLPIGLSWEQQHTSMPLGFWLSTVIEAIGLACLLLESETEPNPNLWQAAGFNADFYSS